MDKMPAINQVEASYYNDFSVLGSERLNGMNIGSIPVTRVVQYANLEGVHDVELFKRIMLRLDCFYINMVLAEQKRKSKPKAKRS